MLGKPGNIWQNICGKLYILGTLGALGTLALLLCRFTLVAANLEAQISRPEDPVDNSRRDTVQIYLDFTGGNLGRSPYRQLRFEIELSAFQQYRSYPVADPAGWSTAVFVSRETEKKLRLGQLPLSQYISNQGGVYYLDYRGIRIAFGLEVPSKAIFDIIENTYANLPEIARLVAEHYRSGYVVRIYETENVLEPENQIISYPEAVLGAVIIGDKEQWLWGIHDARALLSEPMQGAE